MTRHVEDNGRGCFVTFEGGDGTGKSTQIRRLAARLREYGLEVIVTREPGGSEGAELIRGLLLSGETDWDMTSEALLFAAARADHVRKVIAPALERGAWVLSDRYVDSSRAYQGVAGGLGDEHVMDLHALGAKLMPDATILLDLEHAEGVRRTLDRDGGSTDRIGSRDDQYHSSVVASFRQYAQEEPDRILLTDASGTVDEVAERVLGAIGHLVPGGVCRSGNGMDETVTMEKNR